MNINKSSILECTLRDGSYVNGFQFTKHDTSNVMALLEGLGFELIEIGHGMGFGASNLGGEYKAAETDEAYLQAAAETVKSAQWGMFCIPGIAKLEDLDMAADYGMKFIRIGANVENYKDLAPFIEKAKSKGFLTCANMMKSYTLDKEAFADCAVEVHKYGADFLYIVDSAGGMLPDELIAYVDEVKTRSPKTKLGFHGHNNLGLGVANSLVALENGVDLVDTTLQGLGRSAGNAPTEQLLAALVRKGVELELDPIAVMDAGEEYIRPIVENRGLGTVDVASGMALFHSSYMPIIKEFSAQYGVDPSRLIVAVCQHNRAEAPRDLVEQQAKMLAEEGCHKDWKLSRKRYIGGEQNA